MSDPIINMLNQEHLFLKSGVNLDLKLRHFSSKAFYGLAIRIERDHRSLYLTYSDTGRKASSDLLIDSCEPKRTVLKGMLKGHKLRITLKTTKYNVVTIQFELRGYRMMRLYICDSDIPSINAKLYNLPCLATSSSTTPKAP